jgi:predicted dehydrogenase
MSPIKNGGIITNMREGIMINIAIIGCYGSIAPVYLNVLEKLSVEENIKIIAGVDTNLSSDTKLSFPVYRSITEMARRHPEVSAVCILTPPQTHMELVLQALNCNLDVLVEKPPALTVAECEKIVSLHLNNNQQIYFAWHAQHVAGLDKLAKMMKEEILESFHIVQNEDVRNFRNSSEPDLFPGALLDSGINALSVLTKLFNLDHLTVISTEMQSCSLGSAFISNEMKADPNEQLDIAWKVNFNLGRFEQDWLCPVIQRTVWIKTNKHEYLIDIHGGKILRDEQVLFYEDQSDTMHGEYSRQCKDWIKTLQNRTSSLHYEPIKIAQRIFTEQGGMAAC